MGNQATDTPEPEATSTPQPTPAPTATALLPSATPTSGVLEPGLTPTFTPTAAPKDVSPGTGINARVLIGAGIVLAILLGGLFVFRSRRA